MHILIRSRPMRVLHICGVLSLIAAQPAAAQGPADFVGSWELFSMERRSESGAWTPLRFAGAAPVGIITYDAIGNMTVQIATSPRLQTMPPGESAEWTNGYVAYYAAYEVNTTGGFITHYRRNHVNPDVGALPVVRYFEFDGDTLTLTVAPARSTRLRWIRMREQMARGAAEQHVVPIHEEPRHRPVYESPELRVLDVGFSPGDTTLFHRHDAPIAYVFISPSHTNEQIAGQEWGSVDRATPLRAVGAVHVDESFVVTPREHRITNVGAGPFRLIAVVNRGLGQREGGTGTMGTAGPAETQGQWFRGTHHTIAGQSTWEWEAQDRPVVIVQVSSGSVSAQSGSGAAQTLSAPGDFVVVPAGSRATFRSAGLGPMTLAIVEVR